MASPEAVVRGCSVEKLLLKVTQNSKTRMLKSLFNKFAGRRYLQLPETETPTKTLSCEICGIFKNT